MPKFTGKRTRAEPPHRWRARQHIGCELFRERKHTLIRPCFLLIVFCHDWASPGLDLDELYGRSSGKNFCVDPCPPQGPGRRADRAHRPRKQGGGASCEGPEPLRGAASNTSSRTLILWGASSHHEVFQRFTLTGSAQKRVAWREVGQAELAQNAVVMEACTSALVPPGHCQHPNTKLHSVGGGWGQVEGVRHGNREFGASPGSAGKLQVTITQDVRIGFGSTGL